MARNSRPARTVIGGIPYFDSPWMQLFAAKFKLAASLSA